MRKYSIVWASAKLFGGMMQTGAVRVTKLSALKSLGSTMALSTLVNTRKSGASRAS